MSDRSFQPQSDPPSAANDPGPNADTILPIRPAILLSIGLDVIAATASYFTSYWLRFTHDLSAFVPGLAATLPFVVASQIAAMAAGGAYARLPRIDWISRVGGGIIVGTLVGGGAVAVIRGFEGVSRAAFLAAAILMIMAALGWRCIWVLRLRARLRSEATRSAGLLADRAAEMTTLRGVASSLYRYRELLRNLVFKDLKLKYRGSVFGFLWSLLNPLLMILVYAFAFTYIMGLRGQGFIFYLMLGQLAWTFFASSALMSTGAVIDNAGLLKSVLFPRAILPVGTVLFNFAQYLLTVSVFLPMMLVWYRTPLSIEMLLFPLFLMLQVLFTIGLALIVSTATAFFRDVRHLLEVAIQVLFWLTPIVYEFRQIPEKFRMLVLLNPMSSFIIAYHDIFYYRQWPSGTIWLMASVHAAAAMLIGAFLFLSFEDGFTEQL